MFNKDGKNDGNVYSSSTPTNVTKPLPTIQDAKLDGVLDTSTLGPKNRIMAHNKVNLAFITTFVDNFEPSTA